MASKGFLPSFDVRFDVIELNRFLDAIWFLNQFESICSQFYLGFTAFYWV